MYKVRTHYAGDIRQEDFKVRSKTDDWSQPSLPHGIKIIVNKRMRKKADEHLSLVSGVVRLWSQGGYGVWGTEVPQRGPGAEPPGVGVAPRSQICTVCSCQMLFYCRFVTESVLHLPYPPPPPQKKIGSARIPWPNTTGAGWAMSIRGYAFCPLIVFADSRPGNGDSDVDLINLGLFNIQHSNL